MTTYYVGVRICTDSDGLTPTLPKDIDQKIGSGIRCVILGGYGPGNLCAFTDKHRTQSVVKDMTSIYGNDTNSYHVLTIELEE